MLNVIWAVMILISFVCAIFTGKMPELSGAVMKGAGSAIELVIGTLGMMCAWTGFMKIADEGGLTAVLCKVFHPFLKRLFPDYEPGSSALKAVSMNMAANFLGLGNAATPLGIAAMKEMQKSNPNPTVANNSMVMFVVINTASIQLIPTFMGALRAQYGAQFPFDILPAVWLTSVVSLIVGIIVAKLLQGRNKERRLR